ncbi:MAG: hypothetical protein RLZZ15_429 [Verrucomicrobiota bacterium]|jgi:predicted porin
MTKLARVFLTALAVASLPLRAVYAPVPEKDPGKNLVVSAKAGVSHDSNIFGSATDVIASSLVEFAPKISYNVSATDQTFVALGYQLTLDRFEHRPGEKLLDSHDLSARVAHAFTPATTLDLAESFSSSRNPESLLNGLLLSADQSFKRNEFNATFTTPLSAKASASLKGRTVYTTYRNPTLARTLDGYENLYGLSTLYAALPEAKLAAEYRHQDVFYRKLGEDKNKATDYVMTGLDYELAKKLSASARAGWQWRHRASQRATNAPFAEFTAKYDYAPDSFLTAGYNFTLEETSDLDTYTDLRVHRFVASVQHHLTALIVASAAVTYDRGALQGRRGLADLPENTTRLGLGLSYLPTKHWTLHASFDHDRIRSEDPGRAQRRTRVGLNAGFAF